MNTKCEWTLCAIAFAEGQAMSPVQLQKAVFLLGKILPSSVLPTPYYNFLPDNYGPFDGEIYDDVRHLVEMGYVEVVRSTERKYAQYIITNEGKHESLNLMTTFGAYSDKAKEIVLWTCSQSFANLVRTIYNKYPEFKANSIFQG